MSNFNLAGGAIGAKKQLKDLSDSVAYYALVGKEIPNPLTIYAKDYRALADKAKIYLKKRNLPTENLSLFYGQIKLRSQ